MEIEGRMRRLCMQHGWSYGVCWRKANAGESTGLLVEVRYHEGQLEELVDDLLKQVESAKAWIIRAAASRRKHCWFFPDVHHSIEKTDKFKDDELWMNQFLSGIKTIVTVPLPTKGVAIFGSIQKIPENMEFINHAIKTFEMPHIFSDSSLDRSDKIIPHSEGHHPRSVSVPMNGSGISSSSLKIDISLQETRSSGSELVSLFEDAHQCASFLHGQSSVVSDDFVTSLDSYFQQAMEQSGLTTHFSSLINYQHPQLSNDEFSSLDRQLLEMIEMQKFPSNTNPSSSGQYYGSSCLTSYHGINAPVEALIGRGSHEMSKTGFCDYGNFLGNPQSLALQPASGCSLSSGKNPLQRTSFFPKHSSELVSMPTFHENGTLDYTAPVAPQIDAVSQPFRRNFTSANDETLAVNSASSSYSGSKDFGSSTVSEMAMRPADASLIRQPSSLYSCPDQKESCLDTNAGIFSDTDLFDSIDLDLKGCNQESRSWEDVIIPEASANYSNLSVGILDSIPEFVAGGTRGLPKDSFSEFGLEQLLEAGSISNSNPSSYDNISMVNSVLNYNSDNPISVTTDVREMASCRTQVMSTEMTCFSGKGSLLLSDCNFEKLIQGPSSNMRLKSQLSSWIDDCNSMNVESAVTMQQKKPDEPLKIARKRARPGESTRPRPKDRQLIQDRVKELREIVPNSGKCSIDSLLDRTIKHMLYLQSVMKYADKIKQADEPKMIGEESGIVLRDNSSAGGGGATWAFEVAGQTMVCPIIVEDLSPPGQMLIEMLCEERGLFLEIADIIRGFGLTILKGVMEVRNSKIWSRFLVEASNNVTRMEIFLSLVQLLQQTNSNINLTCQPTKDIDHRIGSLGGYKRASLPFPIS